MARQAYKGDIYLAFDYRGSQRIVIPSEMISYVLIENDYLNNVLPVLYLSLVVDSQLYSKIVGSYESSKFYLKVRKKNIFSRNPVFHNVIDDKFSYVTSSTSVNYTDKLNSSGTIDQSYRKILIGLVSIQQTNTLRKAFNNIYNNIDQNTLIGLATEGMKIVMEKPQYNKKYNSIIVPPVNSRYRFLDFIFDKDAFYNTKFQFFMDFDRAYLLSQNGNAVDAGDGKPQSIIIDIRDVTASESFYDGYEMKNGAYYIYVNGNDTNVILNEATEKVANQIIAVSDDSEDTQTLNLIMNNTQDSIAKPMYVRADNAAIIKNSMETTSVMIELLKQNIDGSIFTPNKVINVSNYGSYRKYNGKYIMSYKREFYNVQAGEFYVTNNIGLRRVANIETSMAAEDSKKYGANSAISETAVTRSSANSKWYLSSTPIKR